MKLLQVQTFAMQQPKQQQQQQQTAMLGQPGPSMQQPPQQLQQEPQHRPKIWEGILEWHEQKPFDANKQLHSFLCQLRCNVTADGEPEVHADHWPSKLAMQLINRSVISSIGKAFFENIRSVQFGLQPCAQLERLAQAMSGGSAGCVYFTPMAPADVKVMILLYAAEKRAYFGFIPDDQNGFIGKLKEVMARQKEAMALKEQLRQRQQQKWGWVGLGPAASAAVAAGRCDGQRSGPADQSDNTGRWTAFSGRDGRCLGQASGQSSVCRERWYASAAQHEPAATVSASAATVSASAATVSASAATVSASAATALIEARQWT